MYTIIIHNFESPQVVHIERPRPRASQPHTSCIYANNSTAVCLCARSTGQSDIGIVVVVATVRRRVGMCNVYATINCVRQCPPDVAVFRFAATLIRSEWLREICDEQRNLYAESRCRMLAHVIE